ncbi:flagellar assembly protein FliH [Bacillus toyonensis]|uniref:Flagellar assembly protein FliH n=1 Tax=Bacillus toyonensis TaxID=155322 RepID=A0AB36SS73_9BACI|nr:flagellar assembly protein FliH [Bacillus toyonensis]MED2847149.1 flagellar assembly protein FliH [Bacillus toyonensis]PEN57124.1 flagellar assembly protein FliH [Bacillus toyonensis]
MKLLGLNLLTEKQLNVLLTEAYDKGFDTGKNLGYERGYADGHHKGMTTDKKGTMITHSGIYVFTDENCVGSIDIDKSVKNEMEQLKAIKEDKV